MENKKVGIFGVFLFIFFLPGYCYSSGDIWREILHGPDPEKTRSAIVKDMHEKGRKESRLIIYEFEDAKSRKLTNKTRSNKSDGFMDSFGSWISDTLNEKTIEAVIITKTYVALDLNEVSEGVNVKKDVITISMPKMEIMAVEIDMENSMIPTVETGWTVSSEEVSRSLQRMYDSHKRDISKYHMKNGKSLQVARNSAKEVIEKLVRAVVSNKKYRIEFMWPMPSESFYES